MYLNAQGGANMAHKILRLPAVKAKTGLSRSSVYLFMARGEFPRSVSLGERSVGWVEADVDSWIAGRIADSHGLLRKRPNT